MQHWTSLLLGLLLGAGIAVLVTSVRSPSAPVHPTERPAKASVAAARTATAATAPPDSPDAGPAARDGGTGVAAFSTLPDGSPVPKLPDSAPKQVSFGVVLFQYQGAQYAPVGARSKAEALKLARETVPLAQRDFAEAIKSGDRGSTADAGSVPRGILEPAPEYVLFTLASGAVTPEPVDTPRGYWLMRRR